MTKDIETIYKTLLNEIILLKLKPGERLKEEELSTRFKVSRTPIRDVLKKLETDKLIEIRSQVGTYVAKIDLSGISDIMFIRTSSETSVLLDLMKSITPGDIASLRLLLVHQKETLLEHELSDEEFAIRFHSFDNEFHERIWNLAGKLSALTLLNRSYPYFERYRFLTYFRDEKEVGNLYKIHSKMVDLLEKRDENALRALSITHNYSGLNGIKKVEERHPDYFVK